MIGGWNRDCVGDVEVMDTKTQTWKTLAPIPTARQGMGIGVVDDRFIWTFGGLKVGQGYQDVIEVYDTKTGEWTTPNVKMRRPRYDIHARQFKEEMNCL